MPNIIEVNKESYYLALPRTQGTLQKDNPDFEPWLRFFSRSLKSQKDKLSPQIIQTPQLENLHPDAIKILEHVKITCRITTQEAQKLTDAPRPTVKARLSELVKRKLLLRQSQGRGAWYKIGTSIDFL